MRRFFVILALLCLSPVALALETDQYTVPPKPLDDIGPVWQKHLDESLRKLLDGLNHDFDKAIDAAADASSERTRARRISEAANYLRERALVDRFYDRFGPGLPECTEEHWVHQLHKDFSVSPDGSVYGVWILGRPITIIMMSPTVNAWGVYFGTDKVGHLFQQGHEYYNSYVDHIGEGDAKARAAAVEHGSFQENTLYGYALDGVYSHGDLAADYAGLKFYLNLTHPVVVNGVTRPPIVIIRNSHWERNPAVTDEYLRPFISDHFNESLNPCRYNPQMRGTVRRHLKALTPAWLAFYHRTPAAAEEEARRLSTWYGEDYGHSGMDKLIFVPTLEEKPLVARSR
jgi:hypothetical protein